ncbi:MAG: CHAT domain-containing protein [Acidobacteria bacterium]|nr:CHAT domain-containing protein [Acidobacteriota bacterium]
MNLAVVARRGLVLVFPVALLAQDGISGGRLRVGSPVSTQVAAGEVQRYPITARSGQFMFFSLTRKTGEIAVSLLGPGGVILTARSALTRDAISAESITESAGLHQIEVRNAWTGGEPAQYEVALEELHPATATDRRRVAADRAYWEAEGLRAVSQAESFRQAAAKYDQAIALFRGAGDRAGEAKSLLGLGRAYDALAERRKAVESYRTALPLYRASGKPGGEAYALSYIAQDEDNLGERAKALKTIAQALKVSRDAADRRAEAVCLTYTGQIYYGMGDKQKSLESFERALLLNRSVANRRGEANTLNGMGLIYWSKGDYPKALEFIHSSRMLYHADEDYRDEAATLTNLGAVHFTLDDYAKALTYYEQSLLQWQAVGDATGESATLHNIANAYDRIGEYQKAIDYYNRALPIHRTRGYRVGEANTLTNLGRLYSLLGDLPRALDSYNAALPIHRATSNRLGEAGTVQNVCALREALGNPKAALELCTQALAIRREMGDRAGEAEAQATIAHIHSTLGEFGKAVENAGQALENQRKIGSPRGEGVALNILGGIYRASAERAKALDLHRQALPLFRAVGDPRGEASTLYAMARVERDGGELGEARSHVEAALGLVESLRTKVTGPELRSSYLASVHEYYELQISVLMDLDKHTPAAGFAVAAFETSERARARSLLELLTETGIDIRAGVAPDLLERESSLRRTFNLKANRQMELARGKPSSERSASLAKEIASLTAEYRDVEAQIRARSPRYAELTQPRPLSLEQIREQVLDRDTLLLQFALGEERSYLWTVSADRIRGHELPRRADIETAARHFYTLAKSGDDRASEAARVLSDMLLEPAAAELEGKRLAVAGDGVLDTVPFAALPAPRAAAYRPLIADHEIVNLPSASTLALLRRDRAGRHPARRTLMVFADPVFSKDDPRVETHYPQRSGELRLARLIGSREEAEAILALVPPHRSNRALDFEANREAALNPSLGQYELVHFATHGLVDNEHPELSGLALSMVNRRGEPQDGMLRLDDIFNLHLPADLVVLSACETALGKEVRGEGLMALTRGFMHAGTPRIAASLWKVDDRATKELMRQFYTGMLGPDRLRPAAALRAAQVKLWNQKQWRSPYYWAAFVLLGDWL